MPSPICHATIQAPEGRNHFSTLEEVPPRRGFSQLLIAELYLSLIIASGLLRTNVYTSLVDAASWGSDIPASIDVARQYDKASNPGNFFRIFSLVSQPLALIVMMLFWRNGQGVRIQFLTPTATEDAQLVPLPEGLAAGLYLLEVSRENGEKQALRFVVQR